MSDFKCKVEFVNDFSQKCSIPRYAISVLGCQIGDYVFIRSASCTVICKVFRSGFKNCAIIQADKTVFKNDITKYVTYFPDDFTCLPVVTLRRIKIHVIFNDIETLMNWRHCEKLETYVRHILYQYGVISDCFINCKKHSLGILCGINKMHILDIYYNQSVVGKVTNNTVIEIELRASEDYLNQHKKVTEIHLGGLDRVILALKSLVHHYYMTVNCYSKPRILITGPSGCGKSSIIKKLSSVTNSSLVSVRAINLCRMSSSELKKVCSSLCQAGKFSSSIPCIFFISNIDDDCASKHEKTRMLYLSTALMDLCMNYTNVFVFGTASSSRYLPNFLKKHGRFTTEIRVGVPTIEQREKILEQLTSDYNFDVDVKEIARQTPGYVGSDLAYLSLYAENIANENTEIQERKPCVTTDHFKESLRNVQPSLLRNSNFKMNVEPISWDEIGGLEDIKMKAITYTEWPVLYPGAFLNVGLRCPKGVLLYGPPGCCKTTLARVLATECKATFFSASPAQIYTPFVGDSEKAVIELFRQARLCAPSIIFLDEIESLVGNRGYSGSYKGVHEKVLSALLNEMDGFGVKKDCLQGIDIDELIHDQNPSLTDEEKETKPNENVLVVGATNRIELIDDALIRPGRFDAILYVPPPNKTERKAILQILIRKVAIDSDDDLIEWLAEKTERFSGADLKNLCNTVRIDAYKNSSEITKSCFVTALEVVHPSISKTQLQNYERVAAKYGYVMPSS